MYSPLVDAKEFPENVDVTLVEGAVSSEEDLHKIKMVRSAHQDPGVAGRLRGHRQRAGDAQPVRRWTPCSSAPTSKNGTLQPQIPNEVVPTLLPRRPADPRGRHGGRVRAGLPAVGGHHFPRARSELLEGRMPDLADRAKFG